MKLNGKRVWITGASSGIGEALAKELGSKGAHCFLTARNADKLNQIVSEIIQSGGKAEVFTGDVTDLELMKQIALEITKEAPLDILIANAGTHLFTKPEHFNSAEYLSIMNLNWGGMLHCIESVLPQMIEKKSGRIVGVASLAGFRGLPRAGAYGASKAAMIHFLESIRFHLEKYNVGVTIVNPGFVKTPLTDKNDFKMPFLTDAKDAARIICRGLEKKRDEISFPFPFHIVLKLMRIIPYSIYQWIIKRVWVTENG